MSILEASSDSTENGFLESKSVEVTKIESSQASEENSTEAISQTQEKRKSFIVKKQPQLVFKEAPFKMILKCYVTKNNVSFVITDVLNLVHYKTTGGNETKRGYLKNSQKIISKNIENVIETLKLIKVNYLYIQVKNGFGHKKHSPTLKQVLKLIQTLKKLNFEVCNYIANTTTKSISTIRLQGGRRGRR